MSKTGTYYNVLKNVPLSELKTLRVAVKRNNITTSAPPGPLERGIEDPRSILPCVHYRKGFENSYCLFDREGVLVNQELRSVLADANIIEDEERSNSQSGSRKRSRSLSPTGNRSSNRKRERSSARRSSRERVTNRSRSRDKEDARVWRRKSRSRSQERSKITSKELGSAYRRRSRTPTNHRERMPSVRPHSDDRRRSRSRETEYNKFRIQPRRSRSHSRDRYKTTRKSVSPGNHRRSRSPRRRSSSLDRDKRRVQRQGEYKSRSSRSPGYTERKKYIERPRSRSTSHPRIDREKRRSRSPSRRSRSPRRSEREPIPSDYRRSSRSPRPSSSRTVSTYNRSPYGDRDKRYRKRSRSRSPHKDSSSVLEYHPYYEGIPGAEYWMPNQMRPRLPMPGMPRFFPPLQPFYPRDMSAAYFLQPRFPPGFVPYRQKLPVYNSKPRIQLQSITNDQPSTSANPAGKDKDGTAQETDSAEVNKDSERKDTENDAS